MSPIKDLQVTYEQINEAGTFSQGDSIIGTVTFFLEEETKVKSVFVKAKGDATVNWSEGSGDDQRDYCDNKRYFKVKEYFVAENGQEENLLQRGLYNFKYKLTIPNGPMPRSFKGTRGSVTYIVEAKISRSWRMSTTEKKEINFVPKYSAEQVKSAQSASVSKEVGIFSKGTINLSAAADKKYSSPGESVYVAVKVSNSSSKKVKPKVHLVQKTIYCLRGPTMTETEVLYKCFGNVIEANTDETVSCNVPIPADVIYSLLNCETISVNYHLKVFLDIKFASDPEVVLPLVIGPRLSA